MISGKWLGSRLNGDTVKKLRHPLNFPLGLPITAVVGARFCNQSGKFHSTELIANIAPCSLRLSWNVRFTVLANNKPLYAGLAYVNNPLTRDIAHA
ncbi:hypothetical protein D3C86_1108310 [compost metagenome]